MRSKTIAIKNRALALGVFLTLAVGCTSSDRATAPVTGRVTFDGKPLAGGSINFQPLAPEGETAAGRGSFAYCDSEGNFALETIDGREGAIVAEHRVRIYGPRPKQDTKVDGGGANAEHREIVPPKYNYETNLMFTVPVGGSDEANFDLKNGD